MCSLFLERCHFKMLYAHAQLLQLCLTLCDPVDYSLPGPSVHGDSPGKILEWAAMPSSRGPSQPTDQTPVSCIAGGFFIPEPPGEPKMLYKCTYTVFNLWELFILWHSIIWWIFIQVVACINSSFFFFSTVPFYCWVVLYGMDLLSLFNHSPTEAYLGYCQSNVKCGCYHYIIVI